MTNSLIITGAAGNLGKSVVQLLHDDGRQIYATLGPNDPPDAFAGMERVETEAVNLLDEAETRAYVERITQKDPGVRAGLLLVGGFAMGDIKQTDKAALEKQFQINFETAYLAARPLYEHFEKRGGGQFLLIGTRPALNAAEGKNLMAYALSKSLIFKLSDFINASGKNAGIVSTVVVPGTIDTPVNREAMPDADFSKWVTPQAIAETIQFVLSKPGQSLRNSTIKVYNES